MLRDTRQNLHRGTGALTLLGSEGIRHFAYDHQQLILVQKQAERGDIELQALVERSIFGRFHIKANWSLVSSTCEISSGSWADSR